MAQNSHQQNDDSSPINHFRFMDLPPELRNQIYEMAFTGEFSGEGRVDACASQPPSCALLQTSRKVHYESKQIFTDALRDYYEHTQFSMTFNSDDNPHAALSQIASCFDLQRMQSKRVILLIPQSDATGELVSEPDKVSWALACHPRSSQGPGTFDGFAVPWRDGSGAPLMCYMGLTRAERDDMVEANELDLVVSVKEQIKIMIEHLLEDLELRVLRQ